MWLTAAACRAQCNIIIPMDAEAAAEQHYQVANKLRRAVLQLTRGQSNLTKGRIVAPKIHDRSALTKPEVVFLK